MKCKPTNTSKVKNTSLTHKQIDFRSQTGGLKLDRDSKASVLLNLSNKTMSRNRNEETWSNYLPQQFLSHDTTPDPIFTLNMCRPECEEISSLICSPANSSKLNIRETIVCDSYNKWVYWIVGNTLHPLLTYHRRWQAN